MIQQAKDYAIAGAAAVVFVGVLAFLTVAGAVLNKYEARR